MMNRYIFSFGAAFPITFLLFFLMQLLIYTGKTSIGEPIVFDVPQIPVISPDSPLIEKEDNLVPPPPVPVTPPQPEIMNEATEANPILYTIAPPPVFKEGFGFQTSMTDGPLAPIVRVNPNYPNRAATNGIEGYVVVEFTVDRTGSVADVHVIKSTHRVFERPAIAAVYRWRYKPRVINGEAVNVTGVQTKLTFQLDD